MPTVVAQTLAHCDAHRGQRVLEVGTGTGYNAALLAHRLGAENVTTIEIDNGLVQTARGALEAAGYDVVTGDGGLGCPPAAPFDRILSTAAVQQVPYSWVDQTRPGELVITPWGTDYSVVTDTRDPTGKGQQRWSNRGKAALNLHSSTYRL